MTLTGPQGSSYVVEKSLGADYWQWESFKDDPFTTNIVRGWQWQQIANGVFGGSSVPVVDESNLGTAFYRARSQ